MIGGEQYRSFDAPPLVRTSGSLTVILHLHTSSTATVSRSELEFLYFVRSTPYTLDGPLLPGIEGLDIIKDLASQEETSYQVALIMSFSKR